VKRKDVDLRIVSDKTGKLSRLPGARTYLHTPGAEVALFNALAKVIIDENLVDAAASSLPGFADLKAKVADAAPEKAAAACGLDADKLVELARDYAKAEKALILMPLGQAYPGHGKDLANAVFNLAILTGKIGKEGSGVLLMGEKNNSQGAVDLGAFPTKGKNAAAILDGIAAGTIKTLFIAGENPVVSYPNRKKVEAALEKADFVVVQDLFLTETAEKADVVLPVCSFAEKDGTFTSVERKVQRVRKAVPPAAESRSDFDVLSSLYAAIGGAAPFANVAGAFKAITEAVPAYAGLEFEGLGDTGAVWPVANKPALVPVTAPVTKPEQGKFALLTGSALYHCGTLSLYGKGPIHVCPEGYVELSRSDAQALSINQDDEVTVKSALGEVKLKAKVGTRLPAGVVFAPYHFAEQSINSVAGGDTVTWVAISK